MIRVDLIGPGDIKFHYEKLLRIKRSDLKKELEDIAKSLKSSGVEIALLPDDGVCLEIAKNFKQLNGKVIGLVPKDDKVFGISHLKEYIETKVDNLNLFDEIINTGNWFKHDLTKCLFGDAVLCLGLSPGTDGERAYGVYLYKIVAGFKKGVSPDITKIHKEARAGRDMPYTIFIYQPFIKQKLSYEEEQYAKKFGINLIYVNSALELEKKLKELQE